MICFDSQQIAIYLFETVKEVA